MDRRRAKKDLKKLLGLLKKAKIPYVDLIVFGSVVKGFATEKSDLDICVISNESPHARERQMAKLIYAASKANLNVDLSCVSSDELKKNGWSTFIHQLKKHGVAAEVFLKS